MSELGPSFDSLATFSHYRRSTVQAQEAFTHFLEIVNDHVGELVNIEGRITRVGISNSSSDRSIRLPHGSIFDDRSKLVCLKGHELLMVDDEHAHPSLIVAERPGLAATAEHINGEKGKQLWFALKGIKAFNFVEPLTPEL